MGEVHRDDVTPGEGHTRLEIIERRHMVLGTTFDMFMERKIMTAATQTNRWCITCAEQVFFHARLLSLSQWAHANPTDPPGTPTDDLNPEIHCDALADAALEQDHRCRCNARQAFITADGDAIILFFRTRSRLCVPLCRRCEREIMDQSVLSHCVSQG